MIPRHRLDPDLQRLFIDASSDYRYYPLQSHGDDKGSVWALRFGINEFRVNTSP
jgi:hypothetical protein